VNSSGGEATGEMAGAGARAARAGSANVLRGSLPGATGVPPRTNCCGTVAADARDNATRVSRGRRRSHRGGRLPPAAGAYSPADRRACHGRGPEAGTHLRQPGGRGPAGAPALPQPRYPPRRAASADVLRQGRCAPGTRTRDLEIYFPFVASPEAGSDTSRLAPLRLSRPLESPKRRRRRKLALTGRLGASNVHRGQESASIGVQECVQGASSSAPGGRLSGPVRDRGVPPHTTLVGESTVHARRRRPPGLP